MNPEEQFDGVRAFAPIPAFVYDDEYLIVHRPKAALLLGQILSMLNVTGSFYMSNSKLAKRMHTTTKSINEWLAILEDRGYIRREKITDPSTNAIIGRKIYAGSTLMKNTSWGWSRTGGEGSNVQVTEGSNPDVGRVVTQRLHKYNNIKENKNRTINNNSPAKAEHPPYKEIIDYLNKEAGSSYRSTSKATQKLIRARWNEGYKLEDFKKVIDNQAFAWQGTKWWSYMRPSTLFRESNFENYLNSNDLNRKIQKSSQNLDSLLSTAPLQDINDDDLPF